MRLAVLADVHANLAALNAVLAAGERERVDRVVVAGDLVGYGPLPNETVARVAALDAVCVAGNHDLIVLDKLTDAPATPFARDSLAWTRSVLGEEARAYLESLPLVERAGPVVVAHGSLGDPWRYVRSDAEAAAELDRLEAAHPGAWLLVLGHTHRAAAWHSGLGALPARASALPLDGVTLLNPGSVGHSRGVRPLARFLILDLDRRTAEHRSVGYDDSRTRRELRRAGRPPASCHERPRVVRGAARRVRGLLR